MKLLHTSDWHIGRTLNGFSLLSEQLHAFEQMIQMAQEHQVDGIIIAGDLYDRTIPSTEAVTAFNQMLKRLAIDEGIPVYALTGNHDSAKRLDFGHDFFKTANLHLHTTLAQALTPIETPEAQIFLLPFLDPMDIRVHYKQIAGESDDTVKTYQKISDGLSRVIQDMKSQFDPQKKHILATHFSITPKGGNPEALKDMLLSETTSTIGGLTTLTTELFEDFDYVALGHIHTRLASPAPHMVYSGSPVVFNTKEAKLPHPKGVYLVELNGEGLTKTFLELQVEKPVVVISETFETATKEAFYKTQPAGRAWFSFQLTDYDRKAMAGINVRARLEEIYGRDIVELTIQEALPFQAAGKLSQNEDGQRLAPEQVVSNFYEAVTAGKMTDYQRETVEDILQSLSKEVG